MNRKKCAAKQKKMSEKNKKMCRKFPKNANKCETPPPCSACLELLPMPQTFFREFPHRAQRRAKPEGDARPLDAAKLGARAETSTFGGASAAGLDVGNHFRTLSLVPLLPAALRGSGKVWDHRGREHLELSERLSDCLPRVTIPIRAA